jgi:hypothetical protein
MTEDSLVDQAMAMAAAGLGEDQTKIFLGDVKLIIKHALRDLAQMVCGDDTRRSLLQKEYSVTLTGGVGDLAPTDFDDLLRETVADGRVYLSTQADEDFSDARQYSDYLILNDERLGHYVFANNKIYARQGKAGELNGSLKIWACFLPIPTTLPKELEPEAIQFVAARIVAVHAAGGGAGGSN